MNTIIWSPTCSERGEWIFTRLFEDGPIVSTRACDVEIVAMSDPAIKCVMHDALIGLTVPALFGDDQMLKSLEAIGFWEVASYTSDIEALLLAYGQDRAANLFHRVMGDQLFYIHHQGTYEIL